MEFAVATTHLLRLNHHLAGNITALPEGIIKNPMQHKHLTT